MFEIKTITMFRINKYEDLVTICEILAAGYNTIVEIKPYKEFGWASIAFMTDKFGGVYTILHYDFGTGELRKNYGGKDELDIDSINTLFRVVWDDMQDMLKKRDLEEVYERINDEY